MDIEKYRAQRARFLEQEPRFREYCMTCRQPQFGCYCAEIRRFDPKIKFVILIHPIEVKRRIATGRMSHLCLENSDLLMGEDYSQNTRVNEILGDSRNHNLILYPGRQSLCLTDLSGEERSVVAPLDRKLTIFVIDGTWATARKMIRKSVNLHTLPRICFNPVTPSRFRVRKQPQAGCYSTIEAIHHVIELLGESRGFDLQSRRHDGLLHVFDSMVEKQLKCIDTVTRRWRSVC
jgi:DTW domain-containing protein